MPPPVSSDCTYCEMKCALKQHTNSSVSKTNRRFFDILPGKRLESLLAGCGCAVLTYKITIRTLNQTVCSGCTKYFTCRCGKTAELLSPSLSPGDIHAFHARSDRPPDDVFELYDLRVEVVAPDGAKLY